MSNMAVNIEVPSLSGGGILDLTHMTRLDNEDPEFFYHRFSTFMYNNLLSTACGLSHHGHMITSDEYISPTLENVTVVLWLQSLHPNLPYMVKHKFAEELKLKTLASIRGTISSQLPSLLQELQPSEWSRHEMVTKDDTKDCGGQEMDVAVNELISHDKISSFYQDESRNEEENTRKEINQAEEKNEECDIRSIDQDERISEEDKYETMKSPQQKIICNDTKTINSVQSSNLSMVTKNGDIDIILDNSNQSNSISICDGVLVSNDLSDSNDLSLKTELNDTYSQNELETMDNTQRKKWQCFVCQKWFKHVYSLKRHVQRHSDEDIDACESGRDKLETLLKPKRRRKRNTFFDVGLTGDNENITDENKAASDGNTSETVLDDSVKPYAHLKSETYDDEVDEVDAATVKFSCEQCHRDFASKKALNRHMIIHTDGWIKRYPESGKKRYSSGEKPFSCEYCGKRFKRKDDRAKHERIHTGERPYKCDICDKAFRVSWDLSEHKRTHSGEKPYLCTFCGVTYAHRVTLTHHIRKHTGEKYASKQCNICDKYFSNNSHLKLHMRSHTGEKPYVCSHCGKAFAHQSDLIRHERIHTHEKPYKCMICERAFSQSTSLRKHLLIHEKKGYVVPTNISMNNNANH